MASRKSSSKTSASNTKRAAPDALAKKTSEQTDASERGQNNSFPVVGIGASAGGLEAFRQLLEHLPSDTGMAFVLVQHLDPTHHSILTELLSRSTRIPVSEVRDGMTVEPDHIYVIPPNSNMAIAGGVLRLLPREETRKRYRPIDYFLHTLAEDQGHRAIGVILSGTASDGTLGLEAIKNEGGITFAQDAKSAKHDSMPRSAIAAGQVDFILTPRGIAQELARISHHPYVTPVPTPIEEEAQSAGRNGYRKILALLRRAKGVDFTDYKANTLHRRIARRMVLNKLESTEDYARFLRENVAEVEALYQDILIDVTSFFRNPESFEFLKEKIFPQIVKNRAPDEPVRIWTLGCSTGEEAYSIAISIAEFVGDQAEHIPVQIFATDLNDKGIEKARAGLYSKEIADDLSPDRLRRFFTEAKGGYLVSKPIRDMVVFARQNVLADPPFSRLDLISCRNLLIYLEPVLQKQLLPTLHYSLKTTGFLWLGSSETIGLASDLFTPEDKKHRFYSKKSSVARLNIKSVAGNEAHQKAAAGEHTNYLSIRLRTEQDAQKEAERILLARYSPAGVLINAELEILQYRGATGAYLEPPSGKATLNLLKMAREGLMLPLRSAIQQVRKDDTIVRKEGVRVNYEGAFRTINLEVIPIKGLAVDERCFLVMFEPVPQRNSGQGTKPREAKANQTREKTDRASEAVRLREELAATREYIQSLIDQHEGANEELQSANEEIQSSNEELQSINEELETAKEELESSNEELATLNDELRTRNLELSILNDDLSNLLGSINIPILMLGSDLSIRRFTPQAEKVLSLIPTDVGRPIGDIKLKINLPDLEELITEVIETGSFKEREVQDRQGRWYSMNVRPYRTLDNKIEGAVVVLIDIDDLKNYSEAIVETIREPLIVLDGDLRVRKANRAFYDTFNVSPEKTQNQYIYDLGNRQWNIPKLRMLLEEILPQNSQFQDFEVEHKFQDIGLRTMILNARRLQQESSRAPLILLVIEDITERKQLLAREQAARAEAEEANRIKDEFLATVSHELRTPLNAILGWAQMLRSGQLEEAEVAPALEAIESNARTQNQLVADLLDTSRIIMGKLALEVGPVELITVIQAAKETVRPAAAAKGVELRLELDPTAGPVFGDFARLQQIVWNLLSNAIKYTPQGGYVETRLEREGSSVAIIVKDTGEGISADFLPYIFLPFRQADATTARRHSGLGIGLAIVRHLVEVHGGKVSASSEGAGQGATFRVVFPLSTLSNSDFKLLNKSAAEQSAGLTGLRVLVVDDNRDARGLLSSALTKRGAEVRACATVRAALDILEQWQPDVLVSDIGMPGEDGYDLIRQLRSLPDDRGGQIPAVAVTGYASKKDAASVLAAGYQMFVSKPVELTGLVAIIRSVTQHFGTTPTS